MSKTSYTIPTMMTIKEASEATGLSYGHLRSLCLNKEIVFIRAGSKYLINLEKLIQYLNGDEVEKGRKEGA